MENISYIVPAYNCESTLSESIDSILNGNIDQLNDEIIIVNDSSNDGTQDIINRYIKIYPFIKGVTHNINKGGGAARNTAVLNSNNPLIFCLDSDNILTPFSVPSLKDLLISSGSDAASFQELWFFQGNKKRITHKWIFQPGYISLEDHLSGPITPGASGNYLFTKNSWAKAGGYPENSGALDTWGFGLKQLATSTKMIIMPSSYYFHRVGHESYWVRFSKTYNLSVTALQILQPYFYLLDEKTIGYITGEEGKYNWFEKLEYQPLRVKGRNIGKTGRYSKTLLTTFKELISYKRKIASILKKLSGIDNYE